MSTEVEPGLRERKKAATRQALHDAAVRLATESGPDRITVEAIADEAGVSRRTFSNYFGSKEEALMHGDLQRVRRLIASVRSRPESEPPWAALTAAAADFYREVGELDPHRVAQNRLMRSHPTLLAAQAQTFATMERELAAEVATRYSEPDPSGIRARMTAVTFLAALRVSVSLWLDAPPGTQLGDLVRQALATVDRGFS